MRKNFTVFIFLMLLVIAFHVKTSSQEANILELSAAAKSGLPWYTRYQVGDLPVVGFPGETQREKSERMKEWQDLKFGLFIHWGPQASGGESIIKAEVLSGFNPVDFDAEQWVLTAKKLGFRYVVITTKHHAGFCMFNSQYTDYDIVDATPFKRDPIKELSDACAKHGIKLGIYYSIWDLHHPFYSGDLGCTNYNTYFTYMLGQVEELLTNYGPVATMFFDGEWEKTWTVERAYILRELIRRLQPNTVIANRIGQRRKNDGDYNTPENYMPWLGDQEDYWEGCAKFDGNWFYDGTNQSKTPEWALYNLCYAASRGGNFLLSLGPSPKGTFIETSIAKLERVGKWLYINGESIYEAEKGPHYFLEWGTCSRKGNTLYYHIFDYPKDGNLIIPGLKTEIKSVYFLADPEQKTLPKVRKGNDIHIDLPEKAPYAMANVLKVELNNAPEVDNASRALGKKVEARDAMREIPEGAYFLPVGFAKIHGRDLYFYYGTGAGAQRENLKGWTNESDWAEWDIFAEKSGKYKVEITYGSWIEGGTFLVEVAGQSFQHTVQKMELGESLRQWAPLIVEYKTVTLGEIALVPGRHTLSVRPLRISEDAKKYHQGLMRLRDVTLLP